MVQKLVKQAPFKSLSSQEQDTFFADAKLLSCPMGHRILRPDTLPDRFFLVLSGAVRLLAETQKGSRSLDVRVQGQMLGWVSLLRAEPCEWVIASEDTVLLAVPASTFVACLEANPSFCSTFAQLSSRHELECVLSRVSAAGSHLAEGWQERFQDLAW